MKRTPNKSQHTKLTLERKFLPPILPGIELAFLTITSPALLPASHAGFPISIQGENLPQRSAVMEKGFKVAYVIKTK